MMPGARTRSLSGSAPMPSGKRLTTMTKKSSTVPMSLRRRIATSSSRQTTTRMAASTLELDHAAVAQVHALVGGVDHAAAALRMLAEQRARQLGRAGVERRERLIEQPDRRRPAYDQPRERGAPPLPLRELAHRLVAGDAETRQRVAQLPGGNRQAGERACRAQVLRAGQLVLHRRGVPEVQDMPGVVLPQRLDAR